MPEKMSTWRTSGRARGAARPVGDAGRGYTTNVDRRVASIPSHMKKLAPECTLHLDNVGRDMKKYGTIGRIYGRSYLGGAKLFDELGDADSW